MCLKVGEVYLDKYVSEEKPNRVFIVTSVNAQLVFGKCERNGNLERIYFPVPQIRENPDRFVKINDLNHDKIIANKLAELKGAKDEQRETD